MADITYLLGADADGFYTLAKQYFTAAGSTVVDAPPDGQTLENVCTALAALGEEQAVVNLVSDASGFAALGCSITAAALAAGRRTCTADDLQDALFAKSVAPPGPAVITAATRVVLYGADIGRSTRFLTMLAGLLGNPGELLAPRRFGVFVAGSSVVYRQAQTWSVPRPSPLVPDGATEPTGGWPAFRTDLATALTARFSAAASAAETDGDQTLAALLATAASTATTALGPAFLFEQHVDNPTGTMKPRANGDPVTAPAAAAAQVDDTALATTVSGADAYPSSTGTLAISVVVLAQVIAADVLVAEGPGYRLLTSSEGLAPSLGPASTDGDTPADPGDLDAIIKALVAAVIADGGAQADADAFLAAIPSGDANADIVLEGSDNPLPEDPDPIPSPENA